MISEFIDRRPFREADFLKKNEDLARNLE